VHLQTSQVFEEDVKEEIVDFALRYISVMSSKELKVIVCCRDSVHAI
jgi:hypothetical protein